MYKLRLFGVLIILFASCNENTSNRDQAVAGPKVNPDVCTNLDLQQFLLEMEPASKLTDSCFFTNYRLGNNDSDPTAFQLNSLIVSPTFAEIDSFGKRYYGSSTDKCKFLRISFALNKNNSPIFYFSPVLMEFDPIKSNGTTISYFHIPGSGALQDTFFTWNGKWTGHTAAEVSADRQRYKQSVYKKGVSGEFIVLDTTDPESVVFPFMEINAIIEANIESINKDAADRFVMDSKATKLTFQWAAELDKDGILRHAVVMIPVLLPGTSTYPGPATQHAGNFQTACPPNCMEVSYKKPDVTSQ